MEYSAPVWETGDSTDPDRPYVDANPGAGIKGSIPSAAAVEHPQREIISVIEAAGLTPDAEDLTQLLDAINILLSAVGSPDASTTVKGKVELATGPEALGGTDAVRALTSAALASEKSLTASGYYKFPGGAILQWGKSTADGVNNNWAIAFPTAILAYVPGYNLDALPSSSSCSVHATTTQFRTYVGNSTSSDPVFVIAIGH